MNATIGALGVDRLSELDRLCEATGNDPRPLAIRTTDDEIDLPAQHVALSSNSLRNSLPEMPFRSSGSHDMTTQDLAEVLGLSRTFVATSSTKENSRLTSPVHTGEYAPPTRSLTHDTDKPASTASPLSPPRTSPSASRTTVRTLVRIVLDPCVLYPPLLRDLLLTLASLRAFELRWSREILEEFERNVLADHPEILPMLASWQLNEPINTPAAGPYGRDGNVEYETTP